MVASEARCVRSNSAANAPSARRKKKTGSRRVWAAGGSTCLRQPTGIHESATRVLHRVVSSPAGGGRSLQALSRFAHVVSRHIGRNLNTFIHHSIFIARSRQPRAGRAPTVTNGEAVAYWKSSHSDRAKQQGDSVTARLCNWESSRKAADTIENVTTTCSDTPDVSPRVHCEINLVRKDRYSGIVGA